MGDHHHHHHHHHLTQESSQSMEDQPLNFSALRLESSPTITTTPHHHHHPCSNCGFFGSGSGCITDHSNSASHKRPLPPPSTPTSLLCPTDLNDPQPKPKKLFLEQNDVASQSPPPSAAADDSTPTNPFLLRRCVSDPYHAPPSTDSFRGSGSGIFSNTYSSPQNNVIKTNTNSVTPCSAPLPPRPPPVLRRCVSDPTSSPFKNYSRNSSSNDLDKTPKPKKLGKMWDCWKEMNSKMEELMSEELLEEENDNNNNNAVVAGYEKNDNVMMKNDVVSNEDDVVVEESLSVERKGESLTVRFNCQCGRAYEFLLPGGNCYYKLL